MTGHKSAEARTGVTQCGSVLMVVVVAGDEFLFCSFGSLGTER